MDTPLCALERTVFLSGGPKKPLIFISKIIVSGRRHSSQVQISRVCPQRKSGTVSRGKVLSSKSPLPEKKGDLGPRFLRLGNRFVYICSH